MKITEKGSAFPKHTVELTIENELQAKMLLAALHGRYSNFKSLLERDGICLSVDVPSMEAFSHEDWDQYDDFLVSKDIKTYV